MPTPQPPITIGELTNVPDFESEVSADWCQDATYRICHRFATIDIRDSSGLDDGSICRVAAEASTDAQFFHRVSGTWRSLIYGNNRPTSWTPTVQQNAATTNFAATGAQPSYTRTGRRITCEMTIAYTGASGGTAGSVIGISLPISGRSGYNPATPVGQAFIYDSSAAIKYRAMVVMNNTGQVILLTQHSNTDGYLGAVDFTAALAAGDQIGASWSYDAASTFT
jgi:hypothetical protein